MTLDSKVFVHGLECDPELDEGRRQKQATRTNDILSMPDMLELLIVHQRVGLAVLVQTPASRRFWLARKVQVRSCYRKMVGDRARWVYVRCTGRELR